MLWIQARPPRSIEATQPLNGRGLALRRLNIWMLDHASVQVNTFPSGHVATASAPVGAGVLVVARSIAIATVVGRYHYAIDTVLGTVVGVMAWWIAFR